MTKVYRTARGKNIDMDKIKLANESALAVGNMRVNARGDAIGANGQIAATRNQIMDRVYAIEDASDGYSPNDAKTFQQRQQTVEASKAKELSDLANNLVVPSTTQEPAAETIPTTPAARGSLASAIAKTTAVTQEPMVDPRKPKGPSRI